MPTETPSLYYPEVLTVELGASSYGATLLEYEHELSFLPWPVGTAVPPGVRGLIRLGSEEPLPVLDFRTPSEKPRRYRLLVLMGRRDRYSNFGMAVLIDAPTTTAGTRLPGRLIQNVRNLDRN